MDGKGDKNLPVVRYRLICDDCGKVEMFEDYPTVRRSGAEEKGWLYWAKCWHCPRCVSTVG
jgi:hypothetical protein